MKHLVSIPFSIHVMVRSEGGVPTEEEVEEALLDEYGKYPTVDARDMGNWEVLESYEDRP